MPKVILKKKAATVAEVPVSKMPKVKIAKRKTDIQVELIGEDGNAYCILGRVSKALKRGGYPELAAEYLKKATESDYDNLLNVTMEYVEVV